MDKRQAVLDAFFNREEVPQVVPAVVVSVEGSTCTVQLLKTGIVIDEVRLQADPEKSGFVLTPKKGSSVLVGLIESKIENLYLVQVSEIESFLFSINGVSVSGKESGVEIKKDSVLISLDQGQVKLKQSGVEVQLLAGKVSIKNDGVSLKSLFNDLASLLQTIDITTPSGTGAIGPLTLPKIQLLNEKVNTLLS